MSPPRYCTRLNLNKAELIIGGISILTVLYVIGLIIYNHSTPSQTITFNILSKKHHLQGTRFMIPYERGPSRYRVIRTILTPAHYLVKVQWGDDIYTLTVPEKKGHLLQGGKITFTYRILKNGRLHILKFHDAHVQTDQIPAKSGLIFGYNFKITGTPQNAYTELVWEGNYPSLTAPDINGIMHNNLSPYLVKIGPNNSALYQFEEN